MKSYDELKAEMEAKKNERANALKEVKRLCRVWFTAGMLKGALAKGRSN